MAMLGLLVSGIHCVRPNGAWIQREGRRRCLTIGGAVRLACERVGRCTFITKHEDTKIQSPN